MLITPDLLFETTSIGKAITIFHVSTPTMTLLATTPKRSGAYKDFMRENNLEVPLEWNSETGHILEIVTKTKSAGVFVDILVDLPTYGFRGVNCKPGQAIHFSEDNPLEASQLLKRLSQYYLTLPFSVLPITDRLYRVLHSACELLNSAIDFNKICLQDFLNAGLTVKQFKLQPRAGLKTIHELKEVYRQYGVRLPDE